MWSTTFSHLVLEQTCFLKGLFVCFFSYFMLDNIIVIHRAEISDSSPPLPTHQASPL